MSDPVVDGDDVRAQRGTTVQPTFQKVQRVHRDERFKTIRSARLLVKLKNPTTASRTVEPSGSCRIREHPRSQR